MPAQSNADRSMQHSFGLLTASGIRKAFKARVLCARHHHHHARHQHTHKMQSQKLFCHAMAKLCMLKGGMAIASTWLSVYPDSAEEKQLVSKPCSITQQIQTGTSQR
jgi:hypothetical protein